MKEILMILVLCIISLSFLAGQITSDDLKPGHYTLADVDPEAVPYLEKVQNPDDCGMEAIMAAREEINRSLKQIRATRFNPDITVTDDWIPLPGSMEKLRNRIDFPDNAKSGNYP